MVCAAVRVVGHSVVCAVACVAVCVIVCVVLCAIVCAVDCTVVCMVHQLNYIFNSMTAVSKTYHSAIDGSIACL